MAKSKAAPVEVDPNLKKALESEISKQLTKPLRARIETLKVTDPKTLAEADSYLGRIIEAQRVVEAKIDTILRPLNDARNAALALRRDINAPLERIEQQVRSAMDAYRTLERKRIQAAEDERLKRIKEIEAEELKARMAAAKAPTTRQREILEAKAEEINEKVAGLVATPQPEQVRLAASTTRTIKRLKVTNLHEVLQGILDGIIPDDVIEVQPTILDKYRQMGEALVKDWPGVEPWDEIKTVYMGR